MSAECYKHGCDLVYPPGTWPTGECPECRAEKRETMLEDAMKEAISVAGRLGWDVDPEVQQILAPLQAALALRSIGGAV